MPILVVKLVRLVRGRLRGWRLSVAIMLFVFGTSWLAMEAAEPESNGITDPEHFWWWFIVTSATVGYGDFFPESDWGRVVGAYVIIGGITALTVLFTELATLISTARSRRLRGAAEVDLNNHTVIVGYRPGRTERIVDEFAAENRTDLVVCAWEEDASEHPMPERTEVRFVRGNLTDADVLARAAVPQAATVVLDGRDDNETLTMAVAVDHLNPNVHMVAALRDLNRSEHLRYVNPRVQCVQWHMPKLITEEALDPGITEIYSDLMTSARTGNTYSTRVPPGFVGRTFGECQTHFGREFAATVLAVRDPEAGLRVSPAWNTEMSAGTVLYYVADSRIEEGRLARTS